MKSFTTFATSALIVLVAVSCQNKELGKVTNPTDYKQYLIAANNPALAFTQRELDFWQAKYDKAPNQVSYLSILASNYSKMFEITGDINYLSKAEELLIESNETYRYSSVGTIRALARNYISQHKFREALELANKAKAIGEGLKETEKLLFDVQMELGNYTEAEANLQKISDGEDFDYLIRVAKWNDHLGDLDTTIRMMEKAKSKAEAYDNKYLKIWTYSNLGDFNGHAGNIQQAYDYYLKTLALDPNNSYALKGIAWIVFSHEKDTKEANRIIDIVSKKHNSPDFYLLKAQIAEYENNAEAKSINLNNYMAKLENAKYGAMYNSYNVILFAADKTTAPKALEIAKVEVQHRPTPVSYDLLAWSYYNLGDKEKALAIERQYVEGKSTEPKLHYHMAVIYKANNHPGKVKTLKEELLKSTFELGPNLEQKIVNL
jgi:tetratricopeptide (TPR) repeat protein